ncbi:uncharacterized protein RBU33_018279 isoform 1-T1 [Hipposideros larvatus]
MHIIWDEWIHEMQMRLLCWRRQLQSDQQVESVYNMDTLDKRMIHRPDQTEQGGEGFHLTAQNGSVPPEAVRLQSFATCGQPTSAWRSWLIQPLADVDEIACSHLSSSFYVTDRQGFCLHGTEIVVMGDRWHEKFDKVVVM